MVTEEKGNPRGGGEFFRKGCAGGRALLKNRRLPYNRGRRETEERKLKISHTPESEIEPVIKHEKA